MLCCALFSCDLIFPYDVSSNASPRTDRGVDEVDGARRDAAIDGARRPDAFDADVGGAAADGAAATDEAGAARTDALGADPCAGWASWQCNVASHNDLCIADCPARGITVSCQYMGAYPEGEVWDCEREGTVCHRVVAGSDWLGACESACALGAIEPECLQ